jgi:hypothetical protein
MNIQEYRALIRSEATKRPKKRKEEESVQKAIAVWLKVAHPNLIFRNDMGGIKLPIGLAVKWKGMQQERAYPDFFLAHMSRGCGGLFIEMKKNKDEVYTKDGNIRQSKHIQEQYMMLEELAKRGYMAVFGCGYEDCKRIIEYYIYDRPY